MKNRTVQQAFDNRNLLLRKRGRNLRPNHGKEGQASSPEGKGEKRTTRDLERPNWLSRTGRVEEAELDCGLKLVLHAKC
ncbi:hypothetical protein R1flu_028338 [Riccia fluitans]|uniref:Uncharacterized protein n=1 Tax=Riccia fluitans TaxID=41844 RepID=A0ABD1XLH3_9MARC